MFTEKSELFPVFSNMRTLHLKRCFRNGSDLNDKLEVLGFFLHNAPCMEKLILDCCMVITLVLRSTSFPMIFVGCLTWILSFCQKFISTIYKWETERKNITLPRHDGKTFECPKLKLIEVIYDYDHDHQLIELLWSLGRRLPDANINLIEKERG